MNELNITRRMNTITNGYFRKMLTEDDFKAKLRLLRENEGVSSFPSIRSDLIEMFRRCDIECEVCDNSDYYADLLRRNSDRFYRFNDIESDILKLMFSSFKDYPTPTEYMQRIVDRLSDPADKWQNDTLRLRILKQIIKYGSFLSYKKEVAENGQIKIKTVAVYHGRNYITGFVRKKLDKHKLFPSRRKKASADDTDIILDNLDDSIFDVLSDPDVTKEQRQPEGKYGLLKLADDLAQGQFRTSGATRRDLYMFAIVYDMTYCCDESKAEEYADSDIEKNLFTDYYTNNLMRFITRSYKEKPSAYESNPSGQEINYKNFAEMIYIYYISKDIEPVEKLRLSNEMIERLRNSADGSTAKAPSLGTRTYYSLITENILSMTEREFENFIAANYDCSNSPDEDENGKNVNNKSLLMFSTSKRTAYDDYCELADSAAIQGQLTEDGADGGAKALEKLKKYGLWFVDETHGSNELSRRISSVLFSDDDKPSEAEVPAHLLERINRLLTDSPVLPFRRSVKDHDKHSEVSDFMTLLKKINKYLCDDSVIIVNDPEKLTRTAAIAAYYYHYNAMNEIKKEKKSFSDVYNDYTSPNKDLGILLKKARFQPISDKNLFDMAVIFSSYAYLTR